MFETELHLHPDKNEWILDADLIYLTEKQELIRVPIGFKTDLASIPRLLRALYPKHGLQTRAAVVHDYLYSARNHRYSRLEADTIFYQAMLELGVRKSKAWVMYRAVRMFGGAAYLAPSKGASWN